MSRHSIGRLGAETLKLCAGLSIFIGGVLVVLAAFLASRLATSLPQIDGTLSAKGLAGEVTILRDAHGVPHIEAASRADAYFGLGLVHAQDRLWQMDLLRRAGQGRLAEVFGPMAVSVDEIARTIDLAGAAEASLEALRPETRAAFEAYARGVNLHLASHRGGLGPEFTLLAYRPDPWRAADSVLMLNMVSLGLSSNLFGELRRARMLKDLTAADLESLFPPDPANGHVALPDLTGAELAPPEPLAVMARLFGDMPLGGASNNWVVDGRFTKSGKPILANDPHLGMTAPSVWYLAHVTYPGGEAIGATMAGVPSILIGRTPRIAWGFTTTGADVQDLVIEELDSDDPLRYRTPSGWARMEVRTETIPVRFGRDRRIEIRRTRNGPVLPQTSSFFDLPKPDDETADQPPRALALKWTALSLANTTGDVAMGAPEMRDFDSFKALFERYLVPMQSIVYGDVDGTIGFLAPGQVPIRPDNHPTGGLAPAPGWLAETRWEGTIPFAALPMDENPERGYLLSANHRIVPDSYPYLIAHEWDRPYRAQRIEDVILSRRDHDVASFRRLQLDEVSLPARELLPRLLVETIPDDDEARAALALLAEWDGTMDGARAEPLIFTAFTREIWRGLLADELGEHFAGVWHFDPVFLGQVLAGPHPAKRWCDDVTTDAEETCRVVLRAALARALDDIKARYGADPARWRWGEAHEVVNSHLPFGQVPVLRRFFEIRLPTGGDFYTLNRGGVSFASANPYRNVHGSGYRAIYDLGEPNRSLHVIATGQSGNPFSRFYRDQAELWGQGAYLAMSTDPADYAAEPAGVLTIVPAD